MDKHVVNMKMSGAVYFSRVILLFMLLMFEQSYAQLSSSNYHMHRTNMHNSLKRFSAGKHARVAFLGGSITYNPGWRDSVSQFLKRKFPATKFDFIAAGIPSMGSTPGAFRLERDVLSKGKIDLLFVEAAVNDPTNGRSTTEQIRAMEGIVRHTLKVNRKTDIVFMYFVDPDKMKDYRHGTEPDVITNHERVAQQYAVSAINLAREVTDRIDAGEFSWEKDFKNLHPSPFGQQVYFHSMKMFLEDSWKNDINLSAGRHRHALPKRLDANSYDRGKLIDIHKATFDSKWKVIDDWTPDQKAGTRKGYVHVPMLVAGQPGAALTFSFKGRSVGIAVAAGPDAGMISYRIDGGKLQQRDLFTPWSSGLYLPWYQVLASDLPKGKHVISIVVSEYKHENSTGHACIIKNFFINE